MTTIDSGSWNTTAELENYINSTSEGLSDTQKAQVQQRLDYYKNNPDQKKKEEEQLTDSSSNLNKVITKEGVTIGQVLIKENKGNNFEIGGKNVELGTEVEEGKIPAAQTANIKEKQPFAYNGQLYIKLNGKIFSVQARAGSSGYSDALKLFE
jgi:hypothetical protein